jgi:RNA polymerase sigma-70 factor (ECF subfamily)
MNDEELLSRAKQLDPEALRQLHQRFYEPVVRYIRFKVGDSQTTEDLSGEVFVRILEGLKRGLAWQDSPQGWVMGVARHVVADFYRKRERLTEVKLSDQVEAAAESDPSYRSLLSDQKQRLVTAIQQLTTEQRDVILMRFMEGINIEGVAEAINKSPGAVKGLQYRAIRALAELMQDRSPDEMVRLDG